MSGSKPPGQKRYPVLPPIRCTKEDKELIRKRAEESGLSLSEYVRRMALDGRVVVKHQTMRFDIELIRQLKKIGVNINQQTKRLHSHGQLDRDHKRIWHKLEMVLDQVMSI